MTIKCVLRNDRILVSSTDPEKKVEFKAGSAFTYVAKQGDLALVRYSQNDVFVLPVNSFPDAFVWSKGVEVAQ